MKFKHNKKRNTAFVFESLVREVVKSVVSEDLDRKNKIIKTLKQMSLSATDVFISTHFCKIRRKTKKM